MVRLLGQEAPRPLPPGKPLEGQATGRRLLPRRQMQSQTR